MIILLNANLLNAGSDLVNKSARLNSDATLYGINMALATHSLTLWKQMELCFFFNLDSAIEAFLKTDSLSQNTLAAPSIGMPNILSLYLSDIICSVANLNATNSEPNVEDSTVACFLENHDIGAVFK